ncbi:MAG: helix-turn-helix domain-containing protein [Candidatus Firestonebacteria bacterium]
MEKRYLKLTEVAGYTGLSENTLYRWSREGKIPVCKISNLLRFDKVKIDEWMNNFERENINADLLQNN